MKYYRTLIALFLTCLSLSSANATSQTPLTTDSRIKTYVYSEDEVFMLLLHYGYQSSVEFGPGEEIQTISTGDSYAWNIAAVGRRLFIKPLEENMRTNLTVITNKRTYQFDLVAKLPDDSIDQNLVYVVRFYYPKKEES